MSDDREMTVEQKVDAGVWVNCRICEDMFKRKRETLSYCDQCKKPFCDGEHGTFRVRGRGLCVRCYNVK